MKILLFGALSLLVSSADAQVFFERIIVLEIDSITPAEQMQATVRKWFAVKFKDSNEVIQLDDATTHTIVGKGWTEFGPNAGLHFTIEVECKKGRCRMRIFDVNHQGRGTIQTTAGLISVPSWGPLYDEPLCFTPIRSGMQSEKQAEKQTLKVCEGSRPEIAKRLDSLVESLRSDLTQGAHSSGSDW